MGSRTAGVFPDGGGRTWQFPAPRKLAGDIGLRAVFLCALLGAALLACSDSGTNPESSGLHLELVHGGGQGGLPGMTLMDPVIVRVVDGRGRPVAGIPVSFNIMEGGGLVVADAPATKGLGLLLAEWTLGPIDHRTQSLRASLPDSVGSSSLTVEATALRPDETDVIVFRNASGPLRGVLLVEDDQHGVLDVRMERAATDTVVPIQPIGEDRLDVVVFGQANPPRRATLTWTEGIDTAYVELVPPFPVPMEIKVFEGPFEERVAIVREHLARTEEVWEKEGMGLTLGEITFLDLTEGDPEVNVDVSDYASVCGQAMFGDEIKVSYIHFINSGLFRGHGCGNLVLMAMGSEDYPWLLAHEIGHLFGLSYRPAGLMKPNPPGSHLSDGEVFMAHFKEGSVLNWLFDLHPQAMRRPCFSFRDGADCLPVAYDLPEG